MTNDPKQNPKNPQNPRGTRTDADGKLRYSPTGPAPSSAASTQKLSALPSPLARALAFASILFGGVLGGLIGYSLIRVQSRNSSGTTKALGASLGALLIAGGTAILAVLVLRAMGEWRRVDPNVGNVRLGNDK
jgi:hypothetical protein